jgi:hypothetical protein
MSARLEIEPIIAQATALAQRVERELSTHEGLRSASSKVANAAKKAREVAALMRRPWSIHRLPVVFLTLAITGLLTFVYWQFFHVSTLTLALPDRDAVEIRQNLRRDQRVDVVLREVPGSREAAALLERGEVDLGFVQGGVPIPDGLLRLELHSREVVFFLVREHVKGPSDARRVLTSVLGEGSHTVAQVFFSAWGASPEYLPAWKDVSSDPAFVVPADVDAVFVVKDLNDDKTLAGLSRLATQGFHLEPPRLGARAGRLDYLAPLALPAGHVQLEPPLPASEVTTYSVATFLVARAGLTPRVLTQAHEVIEPRAGTIAERSFRLSATDTSELLQGVDALFSIIVNIGLAFLALLGLDVLAYRRQFHELNSLVSIISVLQSNKDVLGTPEPTRSEHLLYLGLCSDLLSLISVITGYYTQENSSLLFNNLSEVVHERCASLKINIQLKLLHATVPTGR